MDNTLVFCRLQILNLNSQLINSEIDLNDYRRSVKALLQRLTWQARVQFDCIIFS